MSTPPRGRRRGTVRLILWRDYVFDRSGSSAAEFALILPVFALLLFAIIQFGIIFNHYIELANGVAAGARTLAVGRGSVSAYTDTLTAVNNAAPNLNTFSTPVTGQSLTVVVAGTTCTAGNQAIACANAYAAGASAAVTATYPCTFTFLWINLGSCAMTSSSAQYIQ
jgi:Flp pilus assembly protein TadG